MKLKLKTKMIISFVVFLVITLGSSVVIYTLFADKYYTYVMKGVVEEAFYQIIELPIQPELSDDVAEQIETLSEGGVNILICDINYNLIFSTKERDNELTTHRYIKKRSSLYSYEPKVIESENRVHLFGMMEEDAIYYIYIWQNIAGIKNISIYTRNLFLMFIGVTIAIGALTVGIWGGRIVALIKEISIMTKRIAKNDFSMYRIRSKIPNDELGDLIYDIDVMSGIIEKNIQDLKNYNYLLRERTKRIEKYQTMNQEYIATITHDLKTPLAIIGSQVEMLELSDDQEKKKYYVASIQDEIDKMSERISEVLKNSVIERSLKDMILKKVNVKEYLDGLSRKYESWMAAEKIDYSYSGEEVCFAMIEEDTLEHAINNYVMNAFNHTKVGGKVSLELACDNQNCIISVVNEGEAIEDTQINEIWGKYYQNKQQVLSRQSTYGIGLGLQIVKEIVTMHDGEYGVKNVENGVCFYIKLPRMKD